MKYNLNVLDLKPGQILKVVDIEKITGKTYDNLRWYSTVLPLRDWIRIQSKKLGRPLIPRVVQGAIELLQGAEASDYLARQSRIGRKKIYRSMSGLISVDSSGMTPQQMELHNKRLGAQSILVATMRTQAARLPEPKPHRS